MPGQVPASPAEFQSTLSLRRATRTSSQNVHSSSVFQSTLSLRRATRRYLPSCPETRFQSTLSLRRATSRSLAPVSPQTISIHALLAESDPGGSSLVPTAKIFQSTLSLRRATGCQNHQLRFHRYFNPRSPCGERRVGIRSSPAGTHNFNPRSPCGERRAELFFSVYAYTFQSTLSLRRATCSARKVSISWEFQSTLSLRRATRGIFIRFPINIFQSTLSLRRATHGWHRAP